MMNWSALGTWAAVVVALAISLRDTWERHRERTARYLLTSARILPDVGRLRDALELTLEETKGLDEGEHSLASLREASDSFAARLHGMGLAHLKGHADQPDALPEDMLIPLVKAMAVADMLLENHMLRRGENLPKSAHDIRDEFADWREQATSMKTSLDWVVRGAERRMKTARWRFPERWGE